MSNPPSGNQHSPDSGSPNEASEPLPIVGPEDRAAWFNRIGIKEGVDGEEQKDNRDTSTSGGGFSPIERFAAPISKAVRAPFHQVEDHLNERARSSQPDVRKKLVDLIDADKESERRGQDQSLKNRVQQWNARRKYHRNAARVALDPQADDDTMKRLAGIGPYDRDIKDWRMAKAFAFGKIVGGTEAFNRFSSKAQKASIIGRTATTGLVVVNEVLALKGLSPFDSVSLHNAIDEGLELVGIGEEDSQLNPDDAGARADSPSFNIPSTVTSPPSNDELSSPTFNIPALDESSPSTTLQNESNDSFSHGRHSHPPIENTFTHTHDGIEHTHGLNDDPSNPSTTEPDETRGEGPAVGFTEDEDDEASIKSDGPSRRIGFVEDEKDTDSDASDGPSRRIGFIRDNDDDSTDSPGEPERRIGFLERDSDDSESDADDSERTPDDNVKLSDEHTLHIDAGKGIEDGIEAEMEENGLFDDGGLYENADQDEQDSKAGLIREYMFKKYPEVVDALQDENLIEGEETEYAVNSEGDLKLTEDFRNELSEFTTGEKKITQEMIDELEVSDRTPDEDADDASEVLKVDLDDDVLTDDNSIPVSGDEREMAEILQDEYGLTEDQSERLQATAEIIFEDQFDALVERGWLEQDSDGGYLVTSEGETFVGTELKEFIDSLANDPEAIPDRDAILKADEQAISDALETLGFDQSLNVGDAQTLKELIQQLYSDFNSDNAREVSERLQSELGDLGSEARGLVWKDGEWEIDREALDNGRMAVTNRFKSVLSAIGDKLSEWGDSAWIDTGDEPVGVG